MKVEIGMSVVRHVSDYTNGRTGVVIDTDEKRKQVRVHWFTCPKHGQINIKTWVPEKGVKQSL